MCKMADPGFSDDYLKDDTFRLRDDDIFIKEEIELSSGESFPNSSACMPIPTRRTLNSLSDIRDYGVDYMTSSPLMLQDHDKYTTINPNVLWSGKIEENDREEVTKMEDDIFQVDKSDLIQDSNLTELNTNQDILDDLNFDDLMLPAELSCVINVPHISRHNSGLYPLMNTPVSSFDSSYASSCLTENISLYKDSMESSSLPSSPLNITTSSSKTYVSLEGNNNNPNSPVLSPTHNNQKHSSLHELLVKKDSQFSSSKVLGQSVPGVAILQSRSAFSRSSPSSRLSSSAPTHLTMDQIWQRREPRQHLLSTGSLVEAGSTSSLSTGSVLSPEAYDFSLDETCDSEDESDQDDDFSTDAESSDGEGTSSSNSKNAKKERYFWQYNVQSKGPKGQRLVLKSQLEDPHCLNEITDPVFSPDCSLQGIKHSGKARKGDGNDLTPNPKKLYVIGKELDKLNRVINDMTPVSELPHGARPNTRKEKNKLASRACRLKKKAQHEANKIKLLGLETEHKRLIYAIKQMRLLITGQVAPANSLMDNPETIKNVDKIVKQASRLKIAGQTTEFVNKILEKVKAGVPSGGLDEISTMTNL